jgi:hypothetical protein
MNKKAALIVLAMGLMMLFVAVAPAMAEPATRVPASSMLLSSIYYPPLQVHITPSGVAHIGGIQYINTRILTIGGTDYDVYTVGSIEVDQNPKTGTAIFHFTAVWYVGSLTDPTPNGFSGNLEIKVFNYNPVTQTGEYTTSHSVFQGFGIFAQNTLKFEYEGPYPAANLNGYCIIP